mgnify:CR=1 FL=1
MLPIIFAILLLGGAVLAAQSSINGKLGAQTGVVESAWLTFALGAVITFLLMFFFESPSEATLFSVPKWQLIGALFGVVYMLAVISGQLLMSLLIDHFGWLGNSRLPLDPARYLSMALLMGALALIYLSHRKRALRLTAVEH